MVFTQLHQYQFKSIFHLAILYSIRVCVFGTVYSLAGLQLISKAEVSPQAIAIRDSVLAKLEENRSNLTG